MAKSLDDLETDILTILNRSSSNRGYYTQAKIHAAINEAIEDAAVMMQLANEGWLTKITLLDTTAGDTEVDVPTDMVLIRQVRYRVGNVYQPIYYDDSTDQQQTHPDSGYQQFPSRYRIINNKFYFNPPLGTGGTEYLHVEYTSYPDELVSGTDEVNANFDKAFVQYVKWRAAFILYSTVSDEMPLWKTNVDRWEYKVLQIIEKRNHQTQYIREFDG